MSQRGGRTNERHDVADGDIGMTRSWSRHTRACCSRRSAWHGETKTHEAGGT